MCEQLLTYPGCIPASHPVNCLTLKYRRFQQNLDGLMAGQLINRTLDFPEQVRDDILEGLLWWLDCIL